MSAIAQYIPGVVVERANDVHDYVNTVGIVGRAALLGIIPSVTSIGQKALEIPGKIAGGLRMIKCLALPIHIDSLVYHVIKLKDKITGSKKDIDYHAAHSIALVGSIAEDAGLIVLGLNALKVVTLKVVVTAAGIFSFVGVVIQLVSIWADVKRIVQAERHVKKLSENSYELDDKDLVRFKSIVGLSKKQLTPLLSKVNEDVELKDLSNPEAPLNPSYKTKLFAHLKNRVEFGILSRKINIFLSIAVVVAVALQFIPPAALAGWAIIGVVGLSLVALTAFKAYKNYQFNKELTALRAC